MSWSARIVGIITNKSGADETGRVKAGNTSLCSQENRIIKFGCNGGWPIKVVRSGSKYIYFTKQINNIGCVYRTVSQIWKSVVIQAIREPTAFSSIGRCCNNIESGLNRWMIYGITNTSCNDEIILLCRKWNCKISGLYTIRVFGFIELKANSVDSIS